MTSLPSNIDLELKIKHFQHCWDQGQTAFKEAQKSAKKIFTLLNMMKGSLYSTREILKIMTKRSTSK